MTKVEIFARTEVGCVRERNEDAFSVVHLASGTEGLRPANRSQVLDGFGTLLAVCDGMGGAAAGDVAAALAIAQLGAEVRRHGPIRERQGAVGALVAGVAAANRAILEHARQHPHKRGMGTTLTAAVLLGLTAHFIHVGDSRAYLRRGRTLQRLTSDHSVVGQLVASGKLTEEQARSHAQRNALLQALGVQAVVSPEIVDLELRAGDVLILCSDGVHGPVPDPKLLELSLRYEDPMRACRALTEAACQAGGPDNATALVARFVGDGLPVPGVREPVRLARSQATVGP